MSDERVESFPRVRSHWITESMGWPAVTISNQLGLVVARCIHIWMLNRLPGRPFHGAPDQTFFPGGASAIFWSWKDLAAASVCVLETYLLPA
jgi:hypothetical protein